MSDNSRANIARHPVLTPRDERASALRGWAGNARQRIGAEATIELLEFQLAAEKAARDPVPPPF